MAGPRRFSPEVRGRAMRMVLETERDHRSQCAAIASIAEKIGCTPETLRTWVHQVETDTGRRGGLTPGERVRMQQLERENSELRDANEIPRKAHALSTRPSLTVDRGNDRVR